MPPEQGQIVRARPRDVDHRVVPAESRAPCCADEHEVAVPGLAHGPELTEVELDQRVTTADVQQIPAIRPEPSRREFADRRAWPQLPDVLVDKMLEQPNREGHPARSLCAS